MTSQLTLSTLIMLQLNTSPNLQYSYHTKCCILFLPQSMIMQISNMTGGGLVNVLVPQIEYWVVLSNQSIQAFRCANSETLSISLKAVFSWLSGRQSLSNWNRGKEIFYQKSGCPTGSLIVKIQVMYSEYQYQPFYPQFHIINRKGMLPL
jgi:hypothetical protein